MSLTSPSHRAALRFLRGGLVAIVALLVPTQFGFVSREYPSLAPLVALIRIAVPAIGFGIGGAVGGSSARTRPAGVLASGAALLVTGLLLSLFAPLLTNLTGFENRAAVLLFAAATTGTAFALGGIVLALLLGRHLWPQVAAGFLAGGAAGGIVSVLPAVLGHRTGRLAGRTRSCSSRLGCSLVGLLGPFAVAGRWLGPPWKELRTENEERRSENGERNERRTENGNETKTRRERRTERNCVRRNVSRPKACGVTRRRPQASSRRAIRSTSCPRPTSPAPRCRRRWR